MATLAALATGGAIFLGLPPVDEAGTDVHEEAAIGLEGLSAVAAFSPTPDCPERYRSFDSVSLAEVVDVVNRCSGSTVVFADGGLESVRVSGLFDATDVEGFLHLIAASGWATADRRADGTIALHGSDSP